MTCVTNVTCHYICRTISPTNKPIKLKILAIMNVIPLSLGKWHIHVQYESYDKINDGVRDIKKNNNRMFLKHFQAFFPTKMTGNQLTTAEYYHNLGKDLPVCIKSQMLIKHVSLKRLSNYTIFVFSAFN